MTTSSPSTKTSARKPSNFGSYAQPSPSGRLVRERASWGDSGGEIGSGIVANRTRRGRAAWQLQDHDGAEDEHAAGQLRGAERLAVDQRRQPDRHGGLGGGDDRRRGRADVA